MLRELDSDVWETIASCFQFRLMNHWKEDADNLWKQQVVTMVKKKSGKLTMRGFRPIAMLSNWRDRLCDQDVVHSTVTFLVGRRTGWCSCSDG